MRRLEALVGAVTAVTGFEKGSGKTTFLSFALPFARRKGPVAVFSIGVDGRLKGTDRAPSPEIRVQPGDVVMTTETFARASGARFEVLETVRGRTALGRLFLGRAQRGGSVTLVGSEHFSAMSDAIDLVRREGWAQSVLIDGALNRMTQVSALGHVRFAFTARVHPANLARAVARLKATHALAGLPLDGGETDGRFQVTGPLTAETLGSVPPGSDGICIEDFTKVFLEPPDLLRALDRYRVTVRRRFELICLAVTLRDLSREAFLAALGPEASRQVLFNPYEVR